MVTVAEVLGLGLVALGLRLGDVARAPIFDELYHVLSARSWVVDGTFGIADGIYDRAAAFTVLVGMAFEIFGESLIVARIPSITAGTVTIVVLFLWLRSVSGRASAWIAALALCLAPTALATSLHIRFYSLHALMFLCGAIGVYALVTQRRGILTNALLLAATASALALAQHLQITTSIGLIALALWLGLRTAGGVLYARSHDVVLVWVTAFLAAVLVVGVVVVIASDFGAGVLERFRASPLWSIEHRDKFEYYVLIFAAHYPTFFSLFPVAALYAISRQPAAASLCTTIFVVSFLILSFGGSKSDRYIFFALPFFFSVWGIALAEGARSLFVGLAASTNEVARKLFQIRPESGVLPRLQWCVTVLVIAFVMFTNTAFPLGLKMAFSPRPIRANWQAVAPTLRPIADQVDVVLTTEDINALYFIDRHDIFISATKLSEQRIEKEFVADTRTGRPIISTAVSLKRVMACYATGLVIAEEKHWLWDAYVTEALATFILSHMARVELDQKTGIRAYRWHVPLSDMKVGCDGLPRFR